MLWPTHESGLRVIKSRIRVTAFRKQRLSLEIALWSTYDFCIIFFPYLFLIVENVTFLVRKKCKEINSWECVLYGYQPPVGYSAKWQLHSCWKYYFPTFYGHSEKIKLSFFSLNTLLTTDGKCIMPASLALANRCHHQWSNWASQSSPYRNFSSLPPSGSSWASWCVCAAYLWCSVRCTLGNASS